MCEHNNNNTETEEEVVEVEQVLCEDCRTLVNEGTTTPCNCCAHDACESCTTTCDDCGGQVCSDCMRECNECSTTLCRHCMGYCTACDTYLCEDHLYYDEDTEALYCESCLSRKEEGESIKSLEDFYYNPCILEHSVTPNDGWKFCKESWENTTYMGIELEVEQQAKDRELASDELFEITHKYLPKLCIWKYDGSLQNGAELVVTPMTLQYIRKIDYKGLLKALTENFTSHDKGTCGLHIHVNKAGLGKTKKEQRHTIRKLQTFFSANRKAIIQISRRSGESSYAKIPTDQDGWSSEGRYVALNETSETLEFRLFRGTLLYDSFKASLLFVEHLLGFIKNVGLLHIQNDNAMDLFIEYARKNCPQLHKYLTKKVTEVTKEV